MKYLSFTFDDGRYDNYQYALPVLKKYGMPATVYCATGYIDGTWHPDTGWKSAKEPVSVEQLHKLKENGWEIALHGDKHTTRADDLSECVNKADAFGFTKDKYGFSVPNSDVPYDEIQKIIKGKIGKRIGYIRRGRSTNTSSLSAKIQYGLYTFLKIKAAYRAFNKCNVSRLSFNDRYDLPSVVIKMPDDPKMVFDFINRLPQGTHTILMFHSILPKDDPYYGRDGYCWSAGNFENFCQLVSKAAQENKLAVDTVENVLKNYK